MQNHGWHLLHKGWQFLNWAATWQNQQNGMCAQRRLRSAWASAQSDQESSLSAQWVAKDPSFHNADSEDSDQTGQMPRLIWVFARMICHFIGFVMRRLNYLPEVDSRYVFYLVANPEDRFSRDEAHMYIQAIQPKYFSELKGGKVWADRNRSSKRRVCLWL